MPQVMVEALKKEPSTAVAHLPCLVLSVHETVFLLQWPSPNFGPGALGGFVS